MTCACLHTCISCLSCKKSCKSLPRMCWSLTKAWQAQWKMLVCSLDEVWSASRRPAPQVAQPKHLLCESTVGVCKLCLPCRSQWKNHTHDILARVNSHVHTHSKSPLFCVWASDVMPRLCPLCAHRKHSAVTGIGLADFPIPYPGLRCSTNLSASIFTHQSYSSPSLSHTLPPWCQPFSWRQSGHGLWVASQWQQLVHSQAGIPYQIHHTPLHSHVLLWGYQTH